MVVVRTLITVVMVMMVVVMVIIVMVMVSHTHLVPKCKGQPSPETSPTPWPWWRSGMSRCTNVIMMCDIGPDLPMKLMHKYEYHAKYRQDDVPPTFMRRYTNHIAQIWMKPCWWFVTLALIDDFPTLFLVSNPDSSVLFFSTWFLKLISNEFRFGRTCRGAWQPALLLQASAFLAAVIDHRVQHSLRESAFFWWTIFQGCILFLQSAFLTILLKSTFFTPYSLFRLLSPKAHTYLSFTPWQKAMWPTLNSCQFAWLKNCPFWQAGLGWSTWKTPKVPILGKLAVSWAGKKMAATTELQRWRPTSQKCHCSSSGVPSPAASVQHHQCTRRVPSVYTKYHVVYQQNWHCCAPPVYLLVYP